MTDAVIDTGALRAHIDELERKNIFTAPLVREAFNSTNVFVLWSADRETWIVKHDCALLEARTEAEALVAALQAAP